MAVQRGSGSDDAGAGLGQVRLIMGEGNEKWGVMLGQVWTWERMEKGGEAGAGLGQVHWWGGRGSGGTR